MRHGAVGPALAPALAHVAGGGTLDAEASARLFEAIMRGDIAEDDLARFLITQADRGPTVEEIVGAARAMRGAMRAVAAPPGAIDLCGTGGDGLGTLNISTAVSFVVAAAGVPVAKHGNRAASSKSGAADILEAMGIRIDLEPADAARVLEQAGIVFLFAQTHHPAMRHVGPVRRRIGRRTIFNLLGPLASPARVTRQLVGIFARDWLQPYAEALRALGAEQAWVVHGADGLDEMSISGPTHVATLEDGRIALRTVTPEDAGLSRWPLAAIAGGTAAHNAAALDRLLDGNGDPAYHDIVLLNAAAALVVAGKTASLRDGAALADSLIRGGRARAMFNALHSASNA